MDSPLFVSDDDGKPINLTINFDRIIGREVLLKGSFEHSKVKIAEKILGSVNCKNFSIIDVGANIGLYSLYAASKGHSVLAFEPQSHNYSLLNSNIVLNNFQDKIIAYPVCIHSESKLSILHLSDADFGSAHNSFQRRQDQYGNPLGQTIPQGSISISLNSLLDNYASRDIFLKIDVDGNEDFVIQGAVELLSSNSLKGILVELDLHRSDYKLILDSILDSGFVLDAYTLRRINNPLPLITTYNHIFLRK